MKAYRIVQWNEAHETAESRKYKSLSWVATPNKHDGVGYRQVARSPLRAELFAGWNLMLQVASKGLPGVRGWLVRDGRPLTADDLSLMTGFRKSTFEKALLFFASPEMNWIAEEEFSGREANHSGLPGDSSGIPVLQNRTVPDRTEVLKRENGGALASRTQAGALLAQIRELEGRGVISTLEERQELRKKKRELDALQKKQAAGNFE